MRKNVLQWMKKVNATQEEEIDCSACLDQISAYVDLELSAAEELPAAEKKLPAVKHHLDQCAVCHEEYQLLHQLARLEADDSLPPADELAKRLKKHL